MSLVSNTTDEGQYAMDWLLQEEDEAGRYSREAVVIPVGTEIHQGEPLMTDGAGGAIPADGSADLIGVALYPLAANETLTQETAVFARHGRIDFDKLYFDAAVGEPEQVLIKAQMDLVGIVYTPPVAP